MSACSCCNVASPVAAVVLAAGSSRRMGSPKPLLEINGRPMLTRVIEMLLASKAVWPIVVVAGHAADQLQPILRNHPVIVAVNRDYDRGEMLSSVKVGLGTLPASVDAVLLALCDQPMVQAATIATLVSAWRARRPRVLQPRYGGRRGHPIVLNAAGVAEILGLPADATLKTYTSSYPADTIELDVDDPAVVHDIDTPADYAKAVQQQRSASCTEETATA